MNEIVAALTGHPFFTGIEPALLEQMLYPRLDPSVRVTALAQGLPASPGAGSSSIRFTSRRWMPVSRLSRLSVTRLSSSAKSLVAHSV